jgi:hypothetical protein
MFTQRIRIVLLACAALLAVPASRASASDAADIAEHCTQPGCCCACTGKTCRCSHSMADVSPATAPPASERARMFAPILAPILVPILIGGLSTGVARRLSSDALELAATFDNSADAVLERSKCRCSDEDSDCAAPSSPAVACASSGTEEPISIPCARHGERRVFVLSRWRAAPPRPPPRLVSRRV